MADRAPASRVRWLTKAERRRHALELGLPLYIVRSPRPRTIRLSSWGPHAVAFRHTFPHARAWVEVNLGPSPDPGVERPLAWVREGLVSELLFEVRYPKDASPEKGRDWWKAWVDEQQADARMWGADGSRWQRVSAVVDGRALRGDRIVFDDSWAAHFDAGNASVSLRSRWFEFGEIELATASTADVDTIQW